MKRNRQNHIAHNSWGHLKYSNIKKKTLKKKFCEENSESRFNRSSNGFSVMKSWIFFGYPQSHYLLYCKFRVNFLFRKISEKNSTCSKCLPNCCQWKRFFTHFYKGGWCSENLCNIEKYNANRGRKLCSQYEKCVSTTKIKLSISSFQFVY